MYFIDNTSALHCLIKGSAKDWHIDRAVAITHLIAALCGLNIHFEFVESAANWADSVSRDLDCDQFAVRHGFQLETVTVPLELYKVSYLKLVTSLKSALGLR